MESQVWGKTIFSMAYGHLGVKLDFGDDEYFEKNKFHIGLIRTKETPAAGKIHFGITQRSTQYRVVLRVIRLKSHRNQRRNKYRTGCTKDTFITTTVICYMMSTYLCAFKSAG